MRRRPWLVAVCLLLPTMGLLGIDGAPDVLVEAIARFGRVDVEQDAGAGTQVCRDRGDASVFVAGNGQGVGVVRVLSKCGDTGGAYRGSELNNKVWTLHRLGAHGGSSYAYVNMGMTLEAFYLYARDLDPTTGEVHRFWVSGDPRDLVDILE